MRLKELITITSIIVATASFGQIEELKKAQDLRKKYIAKTIVNPTGLSKSQYVNPFVGTGGHGHTYPGATAPFGMIQLSPDTRHDGWDGCSGYHYSDSIIYGFSHTHLSGTGVSDYGDLLIVPQCGSPKTEPGYAVKGGYGSRFSHESEVASPGYYKVDLIDGSITAELTVSKRAGFHVYKFNKSEGLKYILIDLDHRDKVLSANIDIEDRNTISGHRTSEAWATEQHFYFYLTTDIPYKKATAIKKEGKHKLLLIFPEATEQIMVKVGISSVDIEGAKKNVQAEIPDWNFDFTRARVTLEWNSELDKISIKSDDEEVMNTFYTALYHSFLAPNLFNDVDGRYRGRDKEIHSIEPIHDSQYTVFSLWDTYRATHPLFTLTQVTRTNHFINTFLRQFDEGGDLPVWELAGNETECMIGYHSVSVIADAYMKGINGFDSRKACEAMVATSNYDEFAKKQFNTSGYIDASDEPESVSKALEYAYDDFAIQQMINKYDLKLRAVNERSADTRSFKNGMYNFVNSFDPSTKFMRARRSGRWFAPFDPAEVNFNYTEANSWQYSLYAPHAVGILTQLLGGKDSLEVWLDRLFTTESELSGRHQVDITGLIGQYAHGNEPSHHMAYLYNYTNAPHKTQHYVDRILKEMYSNTPEGLSGNEDCGQMSSWYVLSALGIYQIAPSNPYYEFGRPLIDEALLRFENGNKLNIKVINNSDSVVYIQQIKLNDKILDRNYIAHSELIDGGTLEITMGKEPNLERRNFEHAPTLSELPKEYIPLPFFEQTEPIFTDSMVVSLATVDMGNYSIYYTTDGMEPTQTSTKFESPFTLNETTMVKAIALNEYGESAVIENQFTKKDKNLSLKLNTTFANQYAASGQDALIDGIAGGTEYRTGDWQGYWAQPVEATITFEEARVLSEVKIGFLSDMKSWIFLPSNVSFSVSYDGINFEEGITLMNTKEDQNNMAPHKKIYSTTFDSKKPIKKVKILANNYGKCPEWHLGDGNDTWLFADEITFQ